MRSACLAFAQGQKLFSFGELSSEYGLHVNIHPPIQSNSHTKMELITRGTAELGAYYLVHSQRIATRARHSQSSSTRIWKARFPRPPRMMSLGAYSCGLGLGFAISYTSMMYGEMAGGKVCK
jgi:hypothetical protein